MNKTLALFLALASAAAAAGPVDRALAERRQGRFDESILILQGLLKQDPENARAWYELGLSYATDGQYGKAADAYRLALARGYSDPPCHCALALALRECKKPGAALGEARRCHELMPGYAGALNLIGNAEFDLGRFDRALEDYQGAVRIRPNYANAQFNVGQALSALKRDREAEAAFREALRLQPGMPGGLGALGDCLLRLKRVGEAREQFSKALRQDPKDAAAEWGLARAARAMGDEAGAARHERAYSRLTREADNRDYFKKSQDERRRSARDLEAWNKEVRDRN